MIMAGGTGGHVMPALAVAKKLRQRGVEIRWIGNHSSLEARVVPVAGFALDCINIKGLRQSGFKRKVAMPFMLAQACFQALGIMRRWPPDALLGMGGFVSAPGGLVAGLLGKPLVLHEQNAVAGMTNRWLSTMAQRVLCGFPSTDGIDNIEWVGNPVEADIAALEAPNCRLNGRCGGLRILITGGSQGAQVFNQALPKLLAEAGLPLAIWHQCGNDQQHNVRADYVQHGLEARVDNFIDDMAVAYGWSDVVICRAGAMTVAEVCAAGVPALFVPYPFAVSDHQTRNAEYLAAGGAAMICQQQQLASGQWLDALRVFSSNRNALVAMAEKARALAKPDAAERVADICEALIHA